MLSINKTNAFILNICPSGRREACFLPRLTRLAVGFAKLGHWGCWWRHLPVFVFFAVCSGPLLFFWWTGIYVNVRLCFCLLLTGFVVKKATVSLFWEFELRSKHKRFVFQNKCLIADLQILGKRGERRIKCDQSTLKCYIGKAWSYALKLTCHYAVIMILNYSPSTFTSLTTSYNTSPNIDWVHIICIKANLK